MSRTDVTYTWLTRTEPVLDVLSVPHGLITFTGPDADARLGTELNWLGQFTPDGRFEAPFETHSVVGHDAGGTPPADTRQHLRSLLRQDPDVVMVRGVDPTVAALLCDMAATGHLVLVSSATTLPTTLPDIPVTDACTLPRVPAASVFGELPQLIDIGDGTVELLYADGQGFGISGAGGLRDDQLVHATSARLDPAAGTLGVHGTRMRWSDNSGWAPTKHTVDLKVPSGFLDVRSWRAWFDQRLTQNNPVTRSEYTRLSHGPFTFDT